MVDADRKYARSLKVQWWREPNVSYALCPHLHYKVFSGSGTGRVSIVGNFRTLVPFFEEQSMTGHLVEVFGREGYSREQIGLLPAILNVAANPDTYRRVDRRFLKEVIAPLDEIPFRAELTYQERVDGYSLSGGPQYSTNGGQLIGSFLAIGRTVNVVERSSDYYHYLDSTRLGLASAFRGEHFSELLSTQVWREFHYGRTPLCFRFGYDNGNAIEYVFPYSLLDYHVELRTGGGYVSDRWTPSDDWTGGNITGWRFKAKQNRGNVYLYYRIFEITPLCD